MHKFFEDHFPTSIDDAKHWEPYTTHTALAQHVLVAATTRIEGMWCAYADAVPGFNHEVEEAKVLRHGNKVSKPLARLLFPQFEGVPYAE